MNKKLKLFGLLALTLALGAGVAWAAATLTLVGNNDAEFNLGSAAGETNIITGNGTQRANIKGAAGREVLRLNAVEGNTVTVAPVAANVLPAPLNVVQRLVENAANKLQVLINGNGGKGKVVIKASAGDNPVNDAEMTEYSGGTILESGVLGVTHKNSLGQAWVAVLGNPDEKDAPVFQTEAVDVVQLGAQTPSNTKLVVQPLYLVWAAHPNAGNADLRHVILNADAPSESSEGFKLLHGLDQRDYVAPVIVDGAVDTALGTAVNQTANTFVRLVKKGASGLYVDGAVGGLAAGSAVHGAHDGAHHFGGTVVEGGELKVSAGNGAVAADRYRGSLGKVWAAYQGSATLLPKKPFVDNTVGGAGALYNPLYILNDAKVWVDRSQFFSDFNVDKGAAFKATGYKIAAEAGNNYPQIAVNLDQKYSKVDGLLEGQFDLVVNSVLAAARPTNDDTNPAIINDGQAILFINNPENKIFASGDTLIANGVLEIAGAKSIGGGKVTVGATGAADRGFTTPAAGLATFASSKTFKLENEAFTKSDRAALAAERGETLSFKDITMAGTLTINPGDILNHGVPFVAPLMPKNWNGTVEFGAASSGDAVYRATGVMISPTNVFVDRGVWQLNSFPVRTAAQVTNNEDPFMDVTLVEGATLSLGKDVNDFKPYMDLTIRNDSRIRVVLRDSDIAATRGEAMAKDPVFEAREINYRALGYGEANRDRRLAIQLDPTQLTGSTIKKGWVKLVFSPNAVDWNALHFLRENSNVQYEDYAKVRITWTTKSDIVKNAVAHLDENSYTILLEVGEDINDPVNPGTPPAVEKDLKAAVTAPAEVKVGSMVTFELGKWTYTKASGDVEVQDVKWMLDGVDKTADVKADKLTVKAEKEGTMNLVVTAKLKADPTVDGEAKASVAVKKDGGSTGGSSGGCDAGFAGLALLLAAPLFLRKRD